MTKITTTKLERAIWRRKFKFDRKILGFKEAIPKHEVKCDSCGRTKLMSVGQIQKCFHRQFAKSRRKQNV